MKMVGLSLAIACLVITGCAQKSTEPKTPVVVGMNHYEANCASCHGISGAGASMMLEGKNIHFNKAEWQAKYSDAQLAQIILKGRGNMPAFNSILTPAEIKDVVTYMRTLSAAEASP